MADAAGFDVGSFAQAPQKGGGDTTGPTLEVAWRFKTDSLGPSPEFNFQSTPLMVGGVLYTTAGTRRAVVALDAATGEMLWMHSEHEGRRGEEAPRRLSGRGLAYWTDGRDARILYVTPGYQLRRGRRAVRQRPRRRRDARGSAACRARDDRLDAPSGCQRDPRGRQPAQAVG
jgi:hypothetical protein